MYQNYLTIKEMKYFTGLQVGKIDSSKELEIYIECIKDSLYLNNEEVNELTKHLKQCLEDIKEPI